MRRKSIKCHHGIYGELKKSLLKDRRNEAKEIAMICSLFEEVPTVKEVTAKVKASLPTYHYNTATIKLASFIRLRASPAQETNQNPLLSFRVTPPTLASLQ